MEGAKLYDAAEAYLKINYPENRDKRLTKSVMAAYIDGAIFASLNKWHRLSDIKAEVLGTITADDCPGLLFNEYTYKSVFIPNLKTLDNILGAEESSYTHWLSLDYPADIALIPN